MATCMDYTSRSSKFMLWCGYKKGCNVSRLPSTALHCATVLVTVNDHLATSIVIDIKIDS